MGGWGALLIYKDNEKALCGGEKDTTNNRMEMTAAIEALNALSQPCQVALYTDSTYLKNGVQQWMANWKKNNWRTAAKKPVKNVDLWQAVDEACQRHEITWHWVKGHSGDYGNERADELANQGIESLR